MKNFNLVLPVFALLFSVSVHAEAPTDNRSILIHGRLDAGLSVAVHASYATDGEGICATTIFDENRGFVLAPKTTGVSDMIENHPGYSYQIKESLREGLCTYRLKSFDVSVNPASLNNFAGIWGMTTVSNGTGNHPHSNNFNSIRTEECKANASGGLCKLYDQDHNEIADYNNWFADMTLDQEIQIDFVNPSAP